MLMDMRGAVVLVAWCLVLSGGRALAQDTAIVAGPQYRAGPLHSLFFGRDWRSLWTAPVRAPVLDLRTTGGGLSPTTAGGGFQTKSLRFNGGDRYLYGFRSVDKDPSVLPPELEGTLIEDIVRDQTSSAHPGGSALAARLMEASGVLHTDPVLVVLPDDSLLGPFRERFRGTLGFLERRAVVRSGVPPFANALEIIETRDLLPRLIAGPRDRVDAAAYLAARLLDMLMGDWDRHRGQWTWARLNDERPTSWVPIPEDRDQAFVRYDGLLLSLARVYAPQLVNFGPAYPNLVGLTWNGRDLDRRILGALERPSWDSVAAVLQARLSDSVIDASVAALPVEYRELSGEWIAAALKLRRDRLGDIASRFYLQLACEADVFATAAGENVTAERDARGIVLTIVERGGGAPYFRRRFARSETRELRLYLQGGEDSVLVRGEGGGITLLVVGAGPYSLVDSSRGGAVRRYGPDFPRSPDLLPDSVPPRDWGRRWRGLVWATAGPDVGVFLGGGSFLTDYGFRHLPHASKWRVRGGWSTGAATGRLELSTEHRLENSRVRIESAARASGIEVLRFHGFGNETPSDSAPSYYRVNHSDLSLEASLVVPVGSAEIALGPYFRFSDTESQPGRIIASLAPYGAGRFRRLGARADVRLDTRDAAAAATRGVVASIGVRVTPGLLDMRSFLTDVSGEVSTYLTAARAPFSPTLALRAGGRKLLSDTLPPYQDAAFIGDASTARLGRQNRYAGDASLYGNAELRLSLGQVRVVVPGEAGVFGLVDAGRVFLEGETSSRWHSAVGGGIWLAPLKRSNALTLAMAKSREELGIYARAGFAF